MLLGRRLDLAASRDTALVRLVDLGTIVHLEGEVLDSHLIVPVDTAVRGAQPEALHAVLEVDDIFGSSIREVPELLLEPERPKDAVVESQRSLDVSDSQVNVLNPSARHARNPRHQSTHLPITDEGSAATIWFYAARDQETRASAIRSQKRRLRPLYFR